MEELNEKLNNNYYIKAYTKRVNDIKEQVWENSYVKYTSEKVQLYSKPLESQLAYFPIARWFTALSLLGYFYYNIYTIQTHYLFGYLNTIILIALYDSYFFPHPINKSLQIEGDLESGSEKKVNYPVVSLPSDVKSESGVTLLTETTSATTETTDTATEQTLIITEYQVWKRITISTLLFSLLTKIEYLNMPVYLPVLVCYLGGLSFTILIKHIKCLPKSVVKFVQSFVMIGVMLIGVGSVFFIDRY